MGARLHSWWEKARKPLEIAVLIVGCILVIALLVVIVLAYIFTVNVPGLRGKTLWDWLQLLIIPAVLAVGGYLFNYTTTRAEQRNTQLRDQTEQAIATDNQCEAALQAYIDSMSELLLHEKLRDSAEGDEVRKIARVRTLTVLPRLDKARKRSVLQFLYESSLLDKDKPIVDLRAANFFQAQLRRIDLQEANLIGANLSEANLSGSDLRKANLFQAILSGADLYQADLRGAYLREAKLNGTMTSLFQANLSEANLYQTDLRGAYLKEAYLSGTNLFQANLSGANLREANLSEANLREAMLKGAQVTDKQLDQARSLKGATMPDGSIHP